MGGFVKFFFGSVMWKGRIFFFLVGFVKIELRVEKFSLIKRNLVYMGIFDKI